MNVSGLGSVISTGNTYNDQLLSDQTQKNISVVDFGEAVVYEGRSEQRHKIVIYTAKATTLSSQYENYELQNKLASFDCYVGPTDGNLSSDLSKKAIKTFQTLYGLTVNGKMDTTTKTKLNNLYEVKAGLYNNADNVASQLSLDYTERDTFLNVWVYLKEGMGLTKDQAAGACGNMYCESKFSTDNAEDQYFDGDHNYFDYDYACNDGVGYGLIQWTYRTRKEGLKSTADSMGLDVSDINAQLIFFNKEMASYDFKAAWSNIKKASSYTKACDIFLEKIENPEVKNYSERESKAKIIYNCM